MNATPSITTSCLPEMRRSVWLAALVLGTAFFLSEHSVLASLADDFTQNAEEMLATAEGGNTFRRLAYLSIAALGVGLFVAARTTPWKAPSVLGVLMLGIVGLAFASVLWSYDAGQCIRRLFVLGLALVGALGLGRNFNLRELCLVALTVSLGCVLIGIGCELALGTFRPWAGDYRFSGTVHPNTQGAYLATLCFSSLCLSVTDPPRRGWYWAILVAGMVLLVLTKSRTSTAGVLVTLGIVWLVLCSSRVRWFVPAFGAWIVASGLILVLMSGSYADRLLANVAFMGRQEDAESFSGRTTIWPVVQTYLQKELYFGYGYESFWTPPVIEEVSEECQWAVREAHSSYLDMILNLGVVGVVMYCAAMLAGLVMSLVEFQRRRDACALVWFGMVLNGFFNGLFESGMVMISFPTFMIAAGLARLAYFETSAVAAGSEPWRPRNSLSFALGTMS